MNPTPRIILADDGARIWTERAGDPTRPTAILCHGGPGVADTLEPLRDLLLPDHNVIRWDQRGSGRSEPRGPWSIARFVADLDAVRAAYAVDRCRLVGHSWGAQLALEYALAHPARVTRLDHLCGVGLAWWPDHARRHKANQRARLGPRLAEELQRLKEKADRTPDEDAAYRLLYIRTDLHDIDDLALARQLLEEERRHPVSAEANAAINGELKRRALDAEVARCRNLRVPTWILHGASDPRPIEATDALLKALPMAKRRVVEGAGHMPWLEAAEALRAALRVEAPVSR